MQTNPGNDGALDIEAMFDATFTDVTDEDWSRLPKDLTDRLDHYLYGVDEG